METHPYANIYVDLREIYIRWFFDRYAVNIF